MRKRGLNTIFQMAKEHPEVFFMGSDLGFKSLENFEQEIPNQFSMEGVSEAHLVGSAAGLALEGHLVYICTIASFLTRRALDQICINLCLENLPVRLFAFGGGLVYGPLGPTHVSMDDISLMRSLPNMTIVCPSDADEMEIALRRTLHHPGPIYFRVGRGGEAPVHFTDALEFGKARLVSSDGDICLCTTGTMLQVCLDVATLLESSGIQTQIIHIPFIRPFDTHGVLPHLNAGRPVFVIEEHFASGGLYSEICEQLHKGTGPYPDITPINGGDTFIKGYGRQYQLMEMLGLDSKNIASTILKKLAK